MTANWNPDFYKSGYDGFERAENFPSSQALEEYRRLLLEKTEPQVTFIARHVGRRPLRVIEFGSGNGRLLVALALRGMLEFGLGVEISQSRVVFAQRWAEDLRLARVHSVAADALAFEDYPRGTFDLAVCITGAFGYFRPIRETAPAELLEKMRIALASGGRLLLELYELPDRRRQMLALNGGKLRLWQPLPPEDRFAYYLDDLEYWADQAILRHGKIFIGRDGTIDAGRVEVLAYYTDSELIDGLLTPSGFGKIRVFGDFQGSDYCERQSSTRVVLADRGTDRNER